MRPKKLFVCLISTSLLLPTTLPQSIHAETERSSTSNQAKSKASDESQSDTSQSKSDRTAEQTKGQSSHTSGKASQPSKREKTRTQRTSDKEHASYSTKQERTADQEAEGSSALQFPKWLDIFDPNASSHMNGFNLTSWIDQLFHFDENSIPEYDHDQQSTQTQDEEQNTTSSTDKKKADATQSTSSIKRQDNHTDHQDLLSILDQYSDRSHSSSKTHSNRSDNTTTSDHQNQANSDQLDQNDANTTSSDHQQSSDTQTSQHHNTQRGKNDQSSTNQSDKTDDYVKPSDENQPDALDRLLDEYSEKAKDTHQKYQQQKSKQDQDNHEENTDKDTTSQSQTNENPQRPTKKELKTKAKPAQSFDDQLKSHSLRSTTLFQQMPEIGSSNNNDSTISVTESKNTREFIRSIAKDAHKIGQEENLYASVMIAQAILESDSGQSDLARAPHFNLFGMKGSYQGNSATFNTLEDPGNQDLFQIQAEFRSYPNKKASLEDYADLLKHGIEGDPTIYQPAWKDEAMTYQDATAHLATTYATDSLYAKKLNSLIKHYHLTQFDHQRMPSLKHYTSASHQDNPDGSQFKPFEATTADSPYPHGQCTWYVYERMAQYNRSISGSLGDARNWNNRAEDEGYEVASTPIEHSAAVFNAGVLGADPMLGHVAFVEKVNDDGSIVISETNVKGLGVISYRTLDPEEAQQLDYITGKS